MAVGDTYADMVAELGQPQGAIEMGDKTIFFYPAGNVIVADTTVTKVELKTPEQLARDAEVRAIQAKDWQERVVQQTEQKKKRGTELRDRAVADPAFLALTSGEQLAHWRRFQQQYPEVDVTEIVAPLSERYAAEQAELAKLAKLQEQETKIAELEQRVAEAEQKAEAVTNQPSYYANFSTTPYYYPCYQPSRVVIVNGGGPHVYTPKRKYYKDGLNVNGSVGSVNFRYSSGNNGSGPYYWNNSQTKLRALPQSSGTTVTIGGSYNTNN